MPRGKYFSEAIKEEARRLRSHEGLSLSEIGDRLGGIPKHTISGWVRDVELAPEQKARLGEKMSEALSYGRTLTAEAHNRGKRERIEEAARLASTVSQEVVTDPGALKLAAAMLYLAEGSKTETDFKFASSDPQIIRLWLHAERTTANRSSRSSPQRSGKGQVEAHCRHPGECQLRPNSSGSGEGEGSQ